MKVAKKETSKYKEFSELIKNMLSRKSSLYGNCPKCYWKICCIPHFEEHVGDIHKDIN